MKISHYILLGAALTLVGCQTLDTSKSDVDKSASSIAKNNKKNSKSIEDIEKDVATVESIWPRITKNMSLTIADHALVEQYRQWYIDNPKHLEIISKRAEPYLYYIVEEIEKRNFPMELALLPIVESSFDPYAYSRSHASGLWQLMTPTATTFGVKSDWWYDGRRDVISSTTAALDLFDYLYKKMGNDWTYAIAAYNAGEGRVFNAIKRNEARGRKSDYWSLNLPQETAHYLPQLLALADVIKNADRYGITLPHINNSESFKVVNIDTQLDLTLAAKLADISVDELKTYNPGLSRWATSPAGPHRLVVPAEKANKFEEELAKVDTSERINWVRYKIQRGDSISSIAAKFDTQPRFIQNSNGIKGNNIVAGKFLIIPMSNIDPGLMGMSADQTLARKSQKKATNNRVRYTVKSGDTLWKIANSHNVSVKQLTQWNKLTQNSRLSIGYTLSIYPSEIINTTSGNQRTVSYKVQSGDSLARIAAKHKVTIAELIEWNSIKKSKLIQPGQILKLVKSNS